MQILRAADSESPAQGWTLLLTFIGVIAMSALVIFAMLALRETLVRIGSWGYLGSFLAELGNSAVILVPTPGPAYTFAMGGTLNPLALGIVGGIGATLGELAGYFLGLSGRRVLVHGQLYRRVSAFTARWMGIVLVGFAVLPVPFDVAGIWAGSTRYPLWRFLALVAIGKVVKVTAVAFAGYYGMRWLIGPFG